MPRGLLKGTSDVPILLNRAGITLSILLMSLSCKAEKPTQPVESIEHVEIIASEGIAGLSAVSFAGSARFLAQTSGTGAPAAEVIAGKKKKKKKAKGKDKPKDYWQAIPFTRGNFDEVRDYVERYYIQAGINKNRARSEACNYALFSLKERHEVLPSSFYKARKNHPDEEGALKGKSFKLKSSDRYVIHAIPKLTEAEKKKKTKKGRMSDDEIRDL
ncbi:MAG TPA: hypothetical protein EYN66_09905, partial [Myxococcales bacterium]|nr:hypothetical protein [Myxococcales bacterium]